MSNIEVGDKVKYEGKDAQKIANKVGTVIKKDVSLVDRNVPLVLVRYPLDQSKTWILPEHELRRVDDNPFIVFRCRK